MVIPDQCRAAVRVRSDDCDRAAFVSIKRQQPVVFQKYAGFKCGTVCHVLMFFTFNDLVRDRIVFTALVSHHSEQEACCEYPDGGTGYVLFGDHALVISRHDLMICGSAVEIAAGFQSHGYRFQRI